MRVTILSPRLRLLAGSLLFASAFGPAGAAPTEPGGNQAPPSSDLTYQFGAKFDAAGRIAAYYAATRWKNNDLSAAPAQAALYAGELANPKYLHAGEQALLKHYGIYK